MEHTLCTSCFEYSKRTARSSLFHSFSFPHSSPPTPLLYIFRFISPSYPRVSSSKCQLERPDNSIRGNNQQAFPLTMVLCLCVWRYRESHGTEMDCGDECETRWPRLLSESSANIPISRSFLQRRGLKNFSTLEIKRLVSRVYYYRGLIYL